MRLPQASWMQWLAIVSSLLHLLGLGADALAVDGAVHVLTERDFADSVESVPFTFVEFYAPWCGHCIKLEPEWEKTAKLATTYSVAVAKVDAISEESLAQKHKVQSFPSLMLFKGSPDVMVKYTGPREASRMAEWLGKWVETEILLELRPSEAAVNAWAPAAKVKVLGLLSGGEDEDTGLRALLEKAAFALNPSGPGLQLPVAVAPLPGGEMVNLGISGVSLPSIVLLREFEYEEKVMFYEGLEKGLDHFMDWVEQRKAPALIPATRETEQLFLQDVSLGHAIAILFGGTEATVGLIHQLAAEMSSNKDVKWVHAKADEFGESLGKNVGVDKQGFPDFVIWQFGESEDEDLIFKLSHLGFPMEDQEVDRAVRDFVMSWKSGALVPANRAPSKATTSTPPPPTEKKKPQPVVPAKKGGLKNVPCPADADIFACAKWCEEISSDSLKLVGTLGGKPCSERTPDDPASEHTTCTCYDEDFTESKTSCKPECTTISSAEVHVSLIDDTDSGTCNAKDASCKAGSSAPNAKSSKVSQIYDDDDIAADF